MIRQTSLIALFLVSALAAVDQPSTDAAGCKDHPLFTRMPNMRIVNCRTLEFGSAAFRTAKGNQTTPVEGKRFEVRYQVLPGNPSPAPIASIRNHQQAIRAIGGTVIFEDTRYTTLKIARDGKEVWAEVDTAWGGGYVLTIVEKQAMVQQVVASADLFRTGLQSAGHVEVPGIFFDSGKAELKPESSAAVTEVARLLKADPSLKVYVVGHTDNTAALDLNLKLSQSRAESVVQSLIAQHGVAAGRLTGRGVGPLAPVAPNDTDENRARNRRVELVRQ